MKLLTLTLMTLISSLARADFDCRSTDGAGYQVVAKYNQIPVTVSVFLNGKLIHKHPVVETSSGGSIRFRSPTFENANGAPASLFLNVYRDTVTDELIGSFSETSFLPVVDHLQLSCEGL